MKRRKLFEISLYGLGVSIAGIVAVPAVLSALSPGWKRSEQSSWRPLGSIEGFPEGEITLTSVNINRGDWSSHLSTKSVYVWRRKDEDVIVYSRNCTDLSCPIRFDKGSECFFCPCHGGIFSKSGEVMAGPPKSPLMKYKTRMTQDGVLEIDLRSLPPMT